MLLPDPVTIGTFVLVEDVRRELAALVLPHVAVVDDVDVKTFFPGQTVESLRITILMKRCFFA